MAEEIKKEEELEAPAPVPGPFFKWSSEATWITAAKKAGFYTTVTETDEEGKETTKEVLQAYTHNHAIDVVGTLYEGGKWEEQEDGTVKEIEAPTKLDGWHVNYLGPLPTDWDKQEVTPKTPQRIFA